jgi:ABC-2 type transport system ATP-binding protein
LIHARFAQPPNGQPMPTGLQEREQNGNEVTWEYTGPLPPVLDWLSRQPLEDLRVQPLGLAPIYHRYHGAQVS